MSWSRTKTLSTVLFVSLAFNLFLGGAMVGRWGWHGGGHHERGSKHWGAKLWLSRALGDEAAPKVEKIWEAHRAVMKPLREDAKQARKAIHQALSADPFDAAAYERALTTSLERGTAARAGHHAFMSELAAVLTPEQRAKLASFAGRKRWRHRRE
jgi:Spy/CpxP family protein refolding chaperone